MIRLFIGYDSREAVVHHVCVNSIVRHASQPVAVTPLALRNLGGYVELHRDGSNQFTYSRFLVPHLADWAGWALYIDGDMLLRSDIAELWKLRDEGKALLCVHHQYNTKLHEKYLGAKNEDYPRKNWSSVVLWNCAHPANRCLTPQFVQQATGAQLHRFTWLPDELIGELPREWNWLPDELGPNTQAKLLHWTLGAPCFAEFTHAPMAEEWHEERRLMNHSMQRVREKQIP
jgi:lipopolysaccharide biosynthesis glycosyltransferase